MVWAFIAGGILGAFAMLGAIVAFILAYIEIEIPSQ